MEVFRKIDDLKIFAKISGKHLRIGFSSEYFAIFLKTLSDDCLLRMTMFCNKFSSWVMIIPEAAVLRCS